MLLQRVARLPPPALLLFHHRPRSHLLPYDVRADFAILECSSAAWDEQVTPQEQTSDAPPAPPSVASALDGIPAAVAGGARLRSRVLADWALAALCNPWETKPDKVCPWRRGGKGLRTAQERGWQNRRPFPLRTVSSSFCPHLSTVCEAVHGVARGRFCEQWRREGPFRGSHARTHATSSAPPPSPRTSLRDPPALCRASPQKGVSRTKCSHLILISHNVLSRWGFKVNCPRKPSTYRFD